MPTEYSEDRIVVHIVHTTDWQRGLEERAEAYQSAANERFSVLEKRAADLQPRMVNCVEGLTRAARWGVVIVACGVTAFILSLIK